MVARSEPPYVLLLDTNIVVLSWRYRVGDEGYDLLGALRHLARNGQERLALDLLSLDELFSVARVAGIALLRQARRGLRLGDVGELGNSLDQPVRPAN